jgi:hypothetical protein
MINHLLSGFELAFGPLSDYAIFALLPSYHENKNASLLYMVDQLHKSIWQSRRIFSE